MRHLLEGIKDIKNVIYIRFSFEFLFVIEKHEKFCGISFCDWKNLGTFVALIFAIQGQNRKNLFRKN